MFRLVFAVDEITEDLKRAVEYLNAHTVDGTEVIVLELGYSRVGDVESSSPLVRRGGGAEQAGQQGQASVDRNGPVTQSGPRFHLPS